VLAWLSLDDLGIAKSLNSSILGYSRDTLRLAAEELFGLSSCNWLPLRAFFI